MIDSECIHKSGQIIDDYTCVLNQTDIRANANKYYIMQAIDNNNVYVLYLRWGRIGNKGTSKYSNYTYKEDCLAAYEKQFKNKTNNFWANRSQFCKKTGKYFLSEVECIKEEPKTQPKPKSNKISVSIKRKSLLNKRIQYLVSLISNKTMMNNTLIDLNIDVTRMPLGKLKASQILKAKATLNKIRNNMGNITELSSEYYTYIPCDCGRNIPPLINSIEIIDKYSSILDELSNIIVANKIQTCDKTLHVLDNVYNGLNTQIQSLDKSSDMWKYLSMYIDNTHAHTHNCKITIEDIYSVERNGKYEKYNAIAEKIGNRQLLIHGSRLSNWCSILKSGLMLDPSKLGVHVTGKMFGYGIYWAMSSTKSGNYCGINKGQKGMICMAIAEVAVGNELEKLTSDYGISDTILKKSGHDSVWGRGQYTPSSYTTVDNVKIPTGKLVPSNKSTVLRYDEKIVYNTDQFCIKYLVVAHMENLD